MAKPGKQARHKRTQQLARQAAYRRRQHARKTLLSGIALLAVLGLIATLFLVRAPQDTSPQALPCPADDGTSPRTLSFPAKPPTCIDAAKQYTATFETSEGKVVVALDSANTPKTVNNFVYLSRYHYYDETKLFRTDSSIGIIQGGAPQTQSSRDPGPGYVIDDEGKEHSYEVGDLIMARSSVGAGSQFFFGAGPNVSNLSYHPERPTSGTYVRFGKTLEGLDVLQAILALHQPTGGAAGSNGAPSRDVTIKSVTITEG